MSRTVHHVGYKLRDSTRLRQEREAAIEAAGLPYVWRRRFFVCEARHRLRSLRYSAAVVATAAEKGRRPRPERVSRLLEAYIYPRTYGMRCIGYLANRQERALRAGDRVASHRARSVLRAAADPVDAAADLDWPDPRHRHFAVWDSW